MKSIFPRALRNSWKTIFDDVDILKSGPCFKRYGHQLLKLIRKFTGENMEEYFVKNFPKVFTKSELSRPSAQDLMKLCNNIVDLRNRNESNEHILNFRRSVVSCFVSSFEIKDMRKAGWKLNKPPWERYNRKRQDDEAFFLSIHVPRQG